MSKSPREVKQQWPEYHLISRKPIAGKLVYKGMKVLAPLRCNAWEVVQNPEFTKLQLIVTSGGSLFDKWIDALGILGQPYDVLAVTPRFTVRLPRPICTGTDNGRMIILHMNRVADLEHLPEE